jgi:hypothetical protein
MLLSKQVMLSISSELSMPTLPLRGTPSITYSGSLLLVMERFPLISTFESPPGPVAFFVMVTPATLP